MRSQLSFLKREVERARAEVKVRFPRRNSTVDGYIVGAFYSHPNGLTRGAQLQVDAMRRAGYSVLPADGSGAITPGIDSPPVGDTVVLHAGAPETARLLNSIRLPACKTKMVGYWAWELPDPPRSWDRYTRFLDEVWTPSSFSAKSLSRSLSLPVRVVPHRVEVCERHIRDEAGCFTVLTMADSRSSFERKNPYGAISAFRKAFGERHDVKLLVKLMGVPQEVQRFRAEVGESPNIEFVTDRLSVDALNRLYNQVDALISLHRAEGFGLPLLEAMARGLPTVATGWSGNVDFMSNSDSTLVPYRLVDVDDPVGVYRERSVWADPDLEFAADALKRLADDRDHYEKISKAAWVRVRDESSFIPPQSRVAR